MELETLCHLVVQNKADQHILGKYSNCNRFVVTMDYLKRTSYPVRHLTSGGQDMCPFASE